jgi:hypothetical protein
VARDEVATLYAFFIVDVATKLPHGEVFWTRQAARTQLNSMTPGVAATYRIRRARLTIFPK